MLEIKKSIVEFMVYAIVQSYLHFMQSGAREVLGKTKSYNRKSDTMGFDAIPEIVYIKMIKKFDDRAIFVTEETDEQTIKNLPDGHDPYIQPIVIVSDPMDRSKYLNELLVTLLEKYFQKNQIPYKLGPDGKTIEFNNGVTVEKLWAEYDLQKEWIQLRGEKPASITGPTTSLTCVFRGKAIASIILNLITKEVVLSCEKGVYIFNINKIVNLEKIFLNEICRKSRLLTFPYPNRTKKRNKAGYKRFVTFLGKEGYLEHLLSCKIFGEDDIEEFLHQRVPGGPSRVLFLSDLQPASKPIGFILANGEKITEWIHWLPIIKYGKDKGGEHALKAFEVYSERMGQKNGIPMSVTPSLSIFSGSPEFGPFTDINRIKQYQNPSHYRSMIAVSHRRNDWFEVTMQLRTYREINCFF